MTNFPVDVPEFERRLSILKRALSGDLTEADRLYTATVSRANEDGVGRIYHDNHSVGIYQLADQIGNEIPYVGGTVALEKHAIGPEQVYLKVVEFVAVVTQGNGQALRTCSVEHGETLTFNVL